jgi:hypothetical protein
MSDSDNLNSSLNTLLASFTHIEPNGTLTPDTTLGSICIDTSNTRIGINTLDPSYSLHIMDTVDYSGNIHVSEFTCISGNMKKLNIDHLDVSSIIFKDTISGPTLDVSSIININTISGINLIFDVSKIDINGTIDLSYSFRPKFFIPSSRDDVGENEIYYDLSNNDGILMIKLPNPP